MKTYEDYSNVTKETSGVHPELYLEIKAKAKRRFDKAVKKAKTRFMEAISFSSVTPAEKTIAWFYSGRKQQNVQVVKRCNPRKAMNGTVLTSTVFF